MRALVQLQSDRGAVTILVALTMMLFMVVCAIAIDSARLYVERRQLQTTADAAVLAGVPSYAEGTAVAVAEAQSYYDENPTTYHAGGYDPGGGDLVQSTTCDVDGVTYECIEATVVSPEVELFFGRAFGYETSSVSATAAAVIGNAALGGDKLVPWMIRDCPDAYGENRGYPDENTLAVKQEMVRVGMRCPYEFSENFADETELFLDTGTSGNFQGVDFNNEGTCPGTPSGYFTGSTGANAYRFFLAGITDAFTPCAIGPGARVGPQTGGMTGPTSQGLNLRNVNGCMNPASFDAAIDVGTVGDDVVRIEQYNPCVMAVAMVVTPNFEPAHPSLLADVPGDITAMQNTRVVDPNPSDQNQAKWRFGELTNGSSDVYIVRRLAFFYLTSRDPYKGVFLRSFNSEDAVLSGPFDPNAGIYITSLVK